MGRASLTVDVNYRVSGSPPGSGGGGGGGGRISPAEGSSGFIGPINRPGASNLQPWEIKKAMQRDRQGLANQSKAFTAAATLAAPISNPTSLWGNILTGVAQNRFFTSQQGQSMLGRVGMSGAGGAAAASVGITGAAIALGLALKGLSKIVEGTIESIGRSQQLFKYRIQSGFGDKTSTARFTAAQVLGVSPSEVMKFGGVMNQLNPALKRANENFAQSYKVVSMVGFRWKVLQVNMESLFTSIAYRAAPALNGMAVALTKVVQIADWLIQRTDKIPGLFNILLQGAALATAGRGAQLGVYNAALLGKLIPDSGSNIGPSGALPKKASAWERMGLVIGGPSAGERTNQLIKKSNEWLDKIHTAVSPKIPQGAQPLNPGIQHNLPRA